MNTLFKKENGRFATVLAVSLVMVVLLAACRGGGNPKVTSTTKEECGVSVIK